MNPENPFFLPSESLSRDLLTHESSVSGAAFSEPLSRLEKELARLEREHLRREIRSLEGASGTHAEFQGRQLLMMASNNYLNLTVHPVVRQAAIEAISEFGAGSGGARLTTGSSRLHDELEAELARFKGVESALLFNTGFMANLGVISALCGPEDFIFSDQLNHASIIDGCRLSKARTIVYRHGDPTDLEAKIREVGATRGLVVSDGIFSMDGDLAPLPELSEIAHRNGLLLMIDEAHALGVIGKTGRGLEEHFGLPGVIDVTIGTLSKALGSEGGCVLGSRVLTEFLKNKARSFIFSTSFSGATAAAALAALRVLEEFPALTENLRSNVRLFCEELTQNGIPASSQSAIVPLIAGSEEKTTQIANHLFERGIWVSAIRSPAVERGKARIRVTLNAAHSKEELKKAAQMIAQAFQKFKE